MTDPAGQLRISLGPGGVTIDSTRPVRAAGVFVGRGVTETARLLPAIFSVCAVAQSAACAAAIEQGLGLELEPQVTALRQGLVAAETLREHLWRILLDWPVFLSEGADAPAMARVMAGYTALHGALTAGSDPFAPGATGVAPDGPAVALALRDLADLVSEGVFGVPPANWLNRVDGIEALTAWAQGHGTTPARLLGRVIEADQAGLGRSSIRPLPDLRAADLERCLAVDARDAADAFVARPTWGGEPRETSPLTRQLGVPLVRALTARFGNGLLPRLAAQLTEVARILAAEGPAGAPGFTAPDALASGVGIAQVPAARGLLVHRVRIDGGRIAEYRVLAPTEWNFHPTGVLAQGLGGVLEGTATADLEPLARLYIAALDPCVAFDLQLPGPD